MCKLGIKFQAKKVEVQLTNPNDYLIDPPDLHVNHHNHIQVHDHVSQQTQLHSIPKGKLMSKVRNLLFFETAACILAMFSLKEALCLSTFSRSVMLPKFCVAAIALSLIHI